MCAATPEECRTPAVSQKASLYLKHKTPADQDQLVWKWIRGAVTTKAEFGVPDITHAYVLCLYDGTRLLASLNAPAGGLCSDRPCWSEKSWGFRYQDNALTSDGLRQLQLKEGLEDGKAKILVKGKGTGLSLPDLTGLSSPVTVQLKRAAGPCWGAQYSFPPALKNDELQFKDKAD